MVLVGLAVKYLFINSGVSFISGLMIGIGIGLIITGRNIFKKQEKLEGKTLN